MDIGNLDHQRAREARRRRQAGMTIIELLAVLAIVGSLSSVAIPKYHELSDRARVAQAIGDLHAIQTMLETRDSLPDNTSGLGVNTTDPWGNPIVYVKFPNGAPRVDRFGVVLNTYYDLYSVGKDGATSSSLNASVSFDDVVRANDGGFLGQAAKF
jgi:general secretion pathway protein G